MSWYHVTAVKRLLINDKCTQFTASNRKNQTCAMIGFILASGHVQNQPEMHQGWRTRLLLTRNVDAVDEVVKKRRYSV